MGTLRVILALAVVVAHCGPIFGLPFFGEGVTAVESFFLISGFYMALVIDTRYRTNVRAFYFNRFLRLFPLYWSLLASVLLLSGLYWLVMSHPLGALAYRSAAAGHPAYFLWAALGNVFVIGSDVITLLFHANGLPAAKLIAIPPIWSLAVELYFYALAPFLVRRRWWVQGALFIAALAVRLLVRHWTGGTWTPWIYYFAPAALPFFLAGSLAYRGYRAIAASPRYESARVALGWAAGLILVAVIATFARTHVFGFQDWRYYTLLWISVPLLFGATRDSRWDRGLGEYSYPLYLIHAWVLSLSAPLRHFIAPEFWVYAILLLSLPLCALALACDARVQRRFKRPAAPARAPAAASVELAAAGGGSLSG